MAEFSADLRVGRDIKLPQPTRDQLDAAPDAARDPLDLLRAAARTGLDGVLVRTIVELSPTLDAGLLGDARALADELGLYLHVGVGKVNPYMTAELPEVRDLGAGDYTAGMVRMIEAAAAIGCHELWTATAFQKPPSYGVHAVDRFRTDVTWPEQLRATTAYLHRLAPILRANGSRLDIETHEEITAAELLAMIEEVGGDVVGVTFDPANSVARGEDPHEVASLLAPHIHLTHLRDVALFPHGPDLIRYLAPCGDGVLDWPRLLGTLLDSSPGLHLTIEGSGAHRGRLVIPRADPRWLRDRGAPPTAATDPLDTMLAGYTARVCAGEVPGHAVFERAAADPAAAGELGDIDTFVARAADALRIATRRISAGLRA
ncbi:sugar phosphate isomerase/epimerase family protein [Nocardia sp. NPDC024068]|uniref:sugar phosphate isomerase/epimerase family protein n=1 Tax=Nocardia sp. NPDC024068 TaxID=3157197 RepID=UPI0033D33EAD